MQRISSSKWTRLWWGLVVLLVDCVHAPATNFTSADEMNFGFESTARGLPLGWSRGERGVFAVELDSAVVHGGTQSVRITASPDGRLGFGSLARRIDVTPFVGKRVRLHGWVRTQGVTGWATLWLRVDGGEVTYEMADSPLGTSSGWGEVVADAMIIGGKELTFGVALAGDGTAWFDDLSIEVVEPPKVVPIRFAGRVVDSSGAPVANAEVALIDALGAVVRHVSTSGDGGFELQATSGKWALSAHAPGRPELVGAFLETGTYETNAEPTLMLANDGGGVTVQGTAPGVARGAWVTVSAVSKHSGDLWVVPFGADGGFSATLPLADRYWASMLSGGVGQGAAVRDGGVADARLSVVVAGPTPPAVVEWISRNAIPLGTTDPSVRLEDTTALRKLIGGAKVVALGEATHGTREFFRLKHRLFRALVSDGFSVFALEMTQAEARTINDYVLTGTGDARSALGRAGMWLWEVEEMVELIEWMRAWNADAAHTPKLQFVGFDLQSSLGSYHAVRRFLEQVAPKESATWLAPIDVLRHEAGAVAFAALSKEKQAEVVTAVAGLLQRFDASRAAWEAATSPAAFSVARQDARTLQQATEQFASGHMSARASVLRDEAMAENIKWLHDTLPPGARMVVSAHNLHVGDVQGRMGKQLRATLGAAWLSIGLELGDGSFQALGVRNDGARWNIESFTFPTPPAGHLSAALLAGGPEVYALDLRTLPASGDVSAWFRSPQLVWEIGYAVRPGASLTAPQVLADRYDALLFVAHTTRARQLPIDFSRMP